MSTARQIIERAMRKIGVVAIDEAPTAAEARTALDVLNTEMHGLRARGVQYHHSTMDFDDPMQVQEYLEGACIDILAAALAPFYGMQAASTLRSIQALQAAYLTIDEVELPASLTYLPSQVTYGRY